MKNLGKLGKDKVTGFKGIIIGKCNYLYGCSQYGLNPTVGGDGKLGDVQWFDEGRIAIAGKGISITSVKVEKNGCEKRNDSPK